MLNREWKAAGHGSLKDVETEGETETLFNLFLPDVQKRLANCLEKSQAAHEFVKTNANVHYYQLSNNYLMI